MNRLKNARKAKNLTQKQVAEYIGITQNAYSYWESGRSKIDSVSLKRLSELFEVTTDYLICNDDPVSRGEVFALSSNTDYDDLPPEAIEEIERFKEFVRTKYPKK